MKVLIACEESQEVCKAFRALGHEAYSCDIQECSGGHPEWHIRGNALYYINPRINLYGGEYNDFYTENGEYHIIDSKWDLLIAHPPCTYMSKAGACRMYPKKSQIDLNRLEKAMQARAFFMEFYNADCDRIAVENPTPLKICNLPQPSQVIQPYEFGHPYSKRTLLWLKGLPPLFPTKIVCSHTPYLPSNTGAFARGKGGSRGAIRGSKNYAKTFPGIARAMAEQWGGRVKEGT